MHGFDSSHLFIYQSGFPGHAVGILGCSEFFFLLNEYLCCLYLRTISVWIRIKMSTFPLELDTWGKGSEKRTRVSRIHCSSYGIIM